MESLRASTKFRIFNPSPTHSIGESNNAENGVIDNNNNKKMSVEYVFFICLFCLAVGWFWANWRNQKAGETADAVGWANRRSPLIYETTDSSNSTRLETIAQYERALEMLALHGNQWLGRNDEERRQNVHLWVWGADAENTCTDFEMWKFLNVARRAQVHEAFNKQKAENFARFNREVDGARVFAGDFEKNPNGGYE